jgi:hypothetical protein
MRLEGSRPQTGLHGSRRRAIGSIARRWSETRLLTVRVNRAGWSGIADRFGSVVAGLA